VIRITPLSPDPARTARDECSTPVAAKITLTITAATIGLGIDRLDFAVHEAYWAMIPLATVGDTVRHIRLFPPNRIGRELFEP
jgi:hypothetical protein